MSDRVPAPHVRLRWWSAVGLAMCFLVLPGPDRTPFSGVPLATKTQLVFVGLLIVGAFSLLFPPRRALRWGWLLALGIAVAAKLALGTALVEEGWKGTYRFVRSWTAAETVLTPQWFYQNAEVRKHRVDRRLDFSRVSFGLHFVNDAPEQHDWVNEPPRDVRHPLRVDWTGYLRPAVPLTVTVTAAGTVTITVDGQTVLSITDPVEAQFSIPAAGEASRVVRVSYVKGAQVAPRLVVRGIDSPVLPVDAFDRIQVSNAAKNAIVIIGALMVALLAGAFVSAYRPVSRLFLEHVWERPSKMMALALFTVILLSGFGHNVGHRHATVPLLLGNDFLAYENQARQILRNGLMMVNDAGKGEPYFFYPLYPYALAGAHALLGEDFGTIFFFNYFCSAISVLIVWRLLSLRIADGALVAVLGVLGLLLWRYWLGYASTAFSDNLYLPILLATLLVLIAALEKPSAWRFGAAGVLTALGAATRPSLLLFVPFAAGAILIQRRLGGIVARVRAAAAYGLGFAAGVSPFTIRNFLLSGKFVLLVASFMMLPMFVQPPENPSKYRVTDEQGGPLGAIASVQRFFEIVASDPLGVAWLEFRKIFFTLGITGLGPDGAAYPAFLFLLTLLFAFALRTRRIPWAVQTIMVAFALSHLIAVTIATPWTYGYKTIIPLHVVFLAGIAFLLPKWGTAHELDVTRFDTPPPGYKPRVSVVLPTYNEKDSIRGVIYDFFATGAVDEVIVINNNATVGTSEEVAGTRAIEIHEPVQGYGAACQRGLLEATGDYIVLCEPDGTFAARDVHKLLAYAPEFDVVFGSRTSQQFVWRGANMGFFLRVGNWAVAKYMEMLFNGPTLTDVGCTMRLVKRHVAEALAGQYRINGSHFGPEMMALILRRHDFRTVQVPVNYKPRVGQSSVTGDPATAFWLGIRMIWLITEHAIEATNESRRATATVSR